MIFRREAWVRMISLGDQVCFSAANFLLTIIFARHYSEHELAGYGIGLSIALLLQGVLRNCYIVQNAVLPVPVFLRRVRAVMGQQAIILGAVIGLELLVLGVLYLVFPQGFDKAVALSVLLCSLLYIQLEFDRIVNIKRGYFWVPFLASVIFLLLNGALFWAIPRYHITFSVTILALAAYCVMKICVLMRVAGLPHMPVGWRLVKRDMRRYMGSSFIGTLGAAGFTHIPVFVLGYMAPALHTAAFVAMRGLMQPILVLIRSMDLIDKNLFHARSLEIKGGTRALLLRQLLIYGGFSLMFLLLLVLLGAWVIELVYGEKYLAFYHVFAGWGAIMFLIAVSSPLETVIVKENALNRYNHYRLIAGAAGVIASCAFCLWWGAMGAVLAALIGWVISVLCAIWILKPVFGGEVKEISNG